MPQAYTDNVANVRVAGGNLYITALKVRAGWVGSCRCQPTEARRLGLLSSVH